MPISTWVGVKPEVVERVAHGPAVYLQLLRHALDPVARCSSPSPSVKPQVAHLLAEGLVDGARPVVGGRRAELLLLGAGGHVPLSPLLVQVTLASTLSLQQPCLIITSDPRRGAGLRQTGQSFILAAVTTGGLAAACRWCRGAVTTGGWGMCTMCKYNVPGGRTAYGLIPVLALVGAAGATW
eukprot:scaffold115115_cov63-Phaeocystis_antarctica.AAC.1